jgi:peptide/nickel transport system substrate-binding protein
MFLATALYGTLILRDPFTGHYIPWFAKSWTIETCDNEGETATKITFSLYEGLKWSDGVPLTSEDVAFTMKYMYDTAQTFYPSVEMIDDIDTDTPHIETPDPHTIVIYFNVQSIWFLEMVGAVPIIPKHVWENIPPEYVEEQGEYVTTGNLTCSGPYVIAGHQPNEWWLLRPNPYFFRKLAGDIDANGSVDIRDVAMVAKAFDKTIPPANPILDQNGDGKIDIRDIALVAKNFGKTDP